MHILEEWRINGIERNAQRAYDRLYELDSLHSDVGSLERATRELSSEVAGLRSELQTMQERISALEEGNN